MAGSLNAPHRSSQADETDDTEKKVSLKPNQGARTDPLEKNKRSWRFVLSPAGLVLPLVLVAVMVYLLVPAVSSIRRSTGDQMLLAETEARASGSESVFAQDEELDAGSPSAASINVESQLGQASALIQQGRLGEAITIYEAVTQQHPKEPRSEYGWASVLLMEDRAVEALVHARRAVELEPMNAKAMTILAQAYLAVGDTGRSIGIGQAAVELDDSSAVAHATLAEAYRAEGQFAQAADEAGLALERDPENSAVQALQAVLLAQLGRCRDLDGFVAQVLAQEPTSELALEARRICEEKPPAPSATVPLAIPEPSPTATPALVATGLAPLEGRIAYPVWNTGTGRYDIYVSEVGGTGHHLLLTGASQPAFSPDGQWLAVNGERHLQENLLVLPLDGAQPWEVSEHIEDGLPIWSPDGKGLAFSSTQHGDRQSRVYVIDAVPLVGRKEAGRALQAGTHDVSGAYPTWVDGGQVVYDGCDYSANPAVCGLWRVPTGPDPGTAVAVTTNPADTAPAAYGTKVAFMSNREGNWDVFVVNDDGSGLVRLTQGEANEGLPAWAPDGRHLAYVSDKGGRWAVWVMQSDGSNQRQVFEIGDGGLVDDWPQQRISWTQ